MIKKEIKYFDLPSYPKGAIKRAQYLRNNMTKAERIVWQYIRKEQLGVRFRRQVPIGRYIVDFFALNIGLVIEIDGGQHYDRDVAKKDEERSDALNNSGLTVVRYNNYEVFTNIEAVIESIGQMVDKLNKKMQS